MNKTLEILGALGDKGLLMFMGGVLLANVVKAALKSLEQRATRLFGFEPKTMEKKTK